MKEFIDDVKCEDIVNCALNELQETNGQFIIVRITEGRGNTGRKIRSQFIKAKKELKKYDILIRAERTKTDRGISDFIIYHETKEYVLEQKGKKIAEKIHKELCKLNRMECRWSYEKGWESPTHKRYLDLAKRFLSLCDESKLDEFIELIKNVDRIPLVKSCREG